MDNFVSIVNNHQLKLERDAKKGEIIDLNLVNTVDTTIILEKINQETDRIYKEKLREVKDKFDLEKKLEIKKAVEEYEKENLNLNNELKNLESKIKNQLLLEFEREKSNYDKEISTLKNQVELIKQQKDNEYINKINELNNEKEVLSSKLKLSEKENELKLTNKNHEFQKILQDKEIMIENLKRERSKLNIKNIGENLEKWCDNEFNNQALATLDNISWQKDNEVIKNSKADFIYKVYATSGKLENELLTSAILEMKSEDPDSINKQPNSKFFKKLNEDRLNKQIEYAILVSELEWDSENDVPIKKVPDYEKMYIVRPQYFMIFLNIITSFGLKYKEILLAKEEERAKFIDVKEIINDFEAMKNEILDNSIKHITTQLEEINKQSEIITKANNKVIEAANMIIARHLQTVINKINNFKIEKITKKIEELS
ncbi:DUF2130 domain-containing protein [Haploplasma axanthum]|nr:DUF2130 domain-containing protein [Haploplasma axanthum]